MAKLGGEYLHTDLPTALPLTYTCKWEKIMGAASFVNSASCVGVLVLHQNPPPSFPRRKEREGGRNGLSAR